MIELHNITKRLDDKLVLSRVNMTVRDGELHLITGEPGSGKSTLLRIMGGVMRPDSGVVVVDDRPIYDNPDVKRTFVFIGSDPYIFRGRNILHMGRFYGQMYGRCDDTLLREYCEMLDIDPLSRLHRTDIASKRLGALAVAASVQAGYILMDDAVSGLDTKQISLLKKLLKRLTGQGDCAVVCTVSDPEVFSDISDTVTVLTPPYRQDHSHE